MRCVLLLPLLLAASPHAQTLGASGPPRAIEEPGKRYIATGAQATGALAEAKAAGLDVATIKDAESFIDWQD